jgi:hypothetical protein
LKNDKLTFRVEKDGIRFFDGIDDPDLFARLFESALGLNADRKKFLVFAFRFEFQVEGEMVPVIVDEDGWAFVNFAKNSSTVCEWLIGKIKTSEHFQEQLSS